MSFRWSDYSTGSLRVLAVCASLIDRLVAATGSQLVCLEGAQFLHELGCKVPSVGLLTLDRHLDVRRQIAHGLAADLGDIFGSRSGRLNLVFVHIRIFHVSVGLRAFPFCVVSLGGPKQ